MQSLVFFFLSATLYKDCITIHWAILYLRGYYDIEFNQATENVLSQIFAIFHRTYKFKQKNRKELRIMHWYFTVGFETYLGFKSNLFFENIFL